MTTNIVCYKIKAALFYGTAQNVELEVTHFQWPSGKL